MSDLGNESSQEYNYVQEECIKPSLLCNFCKKPLCSPVIYECGMMNCLNCSKEIKTCPGCKNPECKFAGSVVPRFVTVQLEELLVVCPSCDAQFKRMELKDHRDQCDVKCENGCGESVAPSKKVEHLNHCSCIPVPCEAHDELCEWKGPRNELSKHSEECMFVKFRGPLKAMKNQWITEAEKRMEKMFEEKMKAIYLQLENKVESSAKSRTKIFVYQSDFDENGLLFYLGSSGKTEIFTNPMKAGHVQVTASNGSYPESVVGREPANCCWSGDYPLYFTLDLKNRNFRVNKFTIRHGWSSGFYVQDFELLGSNDLSTWTTLYVQKEAPYSGYEYPTKTFEVADGKEHFRYFKLATYSANTSSTAELCISGFELYGEMSQSNTF